MASSIEGQIRSRLETAQANRNVVVEILNEDGTPVEVGESGASVGTALHSFAQPIVRYPLGDHVVRGPDRRPCGAPYRTLAGIRGRQMDLLTFSKGQVVHPFQLLDPLFEDDLNWLQQARLVQKERDLIILEIVAPEANSKDLSRARYQVMKVLPEGVVLQIEQLESMQTEASGKFRLCRVLGN